jgi:hypothetical protein
MLLQLLKNKILAVEDQQKFKSVKRGKDNNINATHKHSLISNHAFAL